MNHTPLARLLFEKGYDLKDLIDKKKIGIGYPTLVNFKRGYKLENLRKKIRTKYSVEKEKGKNGRLYFPNRPVAEATDYWVNKIQETFLLKINITGTQPAEDKLRNVFFEIITEPRRIQYIPDEITKKKIAKVFKVSTDKVYEDRSQEKE